MFFDLNRIEKFINKMSGINQKTVFVAQGQARDLQYVCLNFLLFGPFFYYFTLGSVKLQCPKHQQKQLNLPRIKLFSCGAGLRVFIVTIKCSSSTYWKCVSFCVIIQSYYCHQFPLEMSEYLENIDESSLFGFLGLYQAPQSQFLSIHSQPLSYSPYSLQPAHQQSHLKTNKKQLPTADDSHRILQNKSIAQGQSNGSRQNGILYAAQVRDLNELVRQGTKDDTIWLNINFKTIIFSHFKQIIQANELSSEQIQLVLMFGKRSPSFKSLLQLCDPTKGGVELNKLCMKFISSSLIVRRIMESRCKMGTKLQMVKFVEKLRSNIKYGRIVKWKDQRDI